jgi:hypothetical protein
MVRHPSAAHLSGCDAQYDLAALMRRTAGHLVGNAGSFQREHSSYVCKSREDTL